MCSVPTASYISQAGRDPGAIYCTVCVCMGGGVLGRATSKCKGPEGGGAANKYACCFDDQFILLLYTGYLRSLRNSMASTVFLPFTSEIKKKVLYFKSDLIQEMPELPVSGAARARF